MRKHHKFCPAITQELEGNENHTSEDKLVNTLSSKTKKCNFETYLVGCYVLSVVDCSETVVNCIASINRITENDEWEKDGKGNGYDLF